MKTSQLGFSSRAWSWWTKAEAWLLTQLHLRIAGDHADFEIIIITDVGGPDVRLTCNKLDDGHRQMTALWSLDVLWVSSHKGVFLGHCCALLDTVAQMVLSF